MIKVEIILKTDNKKEAPAIMAEIAKKISEGYTGANYPTYYFNADRIKNEDFFKNI